MDIKKRHDLFYIDAYIHIIIIRTRLYIAAIAIIEINNLRSYVSRKCYLA